MASQYQRTCHARNLSLQLEGNDRGAWKAVSVHVSANSLRIERGSIVLQTTKEVCWRAAAADVMVEKESQAALDGVSNRELQAQQGD